jgi:hypothetical protein
MCPCLCARACVCEQYVLFVFDMLCVVARLVTCLCVCVCVWVCVCVFGCVQCTHQSSTGGWVMVMVVWTRSSHTCPQHLQCGSV